MRTKAIAVVAAVGGVLAGVIALAVEGGSSGSATADAVSTSTATTLITRRDLVETETEDGTLGYADPRAVFNRLPGTATWLPAAGRVVRPDGVLYKIDDAPVVLMDGRVPAYRPLGPAVSAGSDVRQLERSLRTTGYDRARGMTIDRTWDAATTAAVRRWQRARGLPQTGTIEPGRIVFLPGIRRVATVAATLGAPTRGPAVTTTSTRRRVTVALDTANSGLAEKGALVKVVLPPAEEVAGRITSVGKVAAPARRQPKASSDDPDPKATIEVTIRVARASSALDRAPVTVRFEQSRREDVLAIPVTALLARPGGRFAVQLVKAGGRPRVVPVRAGLYAGGYVEIAAPGLRPRQRVTNAAVQ